ncbi:MAG: ThiF family adenylyltransferase, partial [Candidatus Jordarchaeaceae archaeon]
GVGNITIVDPDLVEISNLNRQLSFRAEDVGKPKVWAAKKFIQSLNPLVTVRDSKARIEDLETKVFEDADVILGCLDNRTSRDYVNETCILLEKPLVDSGTEGYLGRVQTIFPRKTACLSCGGYSFKEVIKSVEPCTLVGEPRKQQDCAWIALNTFYTEHDREPSETSLEDVSEILKIANRVAKRYGFNPLSEKEIKNIIMYKVPNIISVTSVIGAIQAQEVLKIIHLLNKKKLHKKEKTTLKKLQESNRFHIPSLTVYNGLTGYFYTDDLKVDPECPICSKKPKILDISIGEDETFYSLFDNIKGFSAQETLITKSHKIVFDPTKNDILNQKVGHILNDDLLCFTNLKKDKQIFVRLKIKKKGGKSYERNAESEVSSRI